MAVFKKKENVQKVKKDPQIRIARKTYLKVLSKRIVKVFSLVFVLLFALYLVFAATLLRVVPTLDAGFVPVKNITYEGGIVPKDAQVLVSLDKKQGITAFERFKQAFVPASNAAVIEVVAGPYGKLGWTEPDILTVDGYPTDVVLEPAEGDKSPLESRESEYLEDEYLAICIKGACEVGEGVIVPKDNVIGTPLSKSSVDKIVAGE